MRPLMAIFFYLEVSLLPIFPSNLQCGTRFSFQSCVNFLFLLGLRVPARFNIKGRYSSKALENFSLFFLNKILK